MPDDRQYIAHAQAAQEPLLHLDGVHLARDGRRILDHVHLAVAPDEIVTLIGPNGAGKTMLVRIALGLVQPDSGRVTRRPGLAIGYMPQHFHVEDTLPLTARRFLRLAKGATEAELQAAAAEVGIEPLLNTPLQALSGGELQRTLLARAILRRPQLLVLDEPVRGVDMTGQIELYDLIAQLRRRLGCGVLMVSHDLHIVMAATDRVICLNHHICCHGQPDTVSAHPEYLALFGPLSKERLAVYQHHHDHRHGPHGEVVGGNGHGTS
ncbi:MAG TPA: zinc ABC transporter ATP-binding protein ZnuC [Dongiaceae bacterium]|jgi:zinc transport system ATP-binding protein